MADLLKDVDSFESQKGELVRRMRARLSELDEERRELQGRLQRIEGEQRNGHAKGRALRSETAKMILNLVTQAGADGLPARDVVTAVREATGRPQYDKAIIGTYLSRLRRKGLLRAEGEPGFFRYIATVSES